MSIFQTLDTTRPESGLYSCSCASIVAVMSRFRQHVSFPSWHSRPILPNRVLLTLLLATFLAQSAGLALAQNDKPVKKVEVSLKDAKGDSVGSALIKPSGRGVEVKLEVKGLSAGEHALHFHQKAVCEAPDFKSAGAHFNPDQKQHGFVNPNGHHNGDMANFTVKADGTAKVTVKNADVVLGTGSEANSLFANGGTSLVIHAKADDMKTDPAGNAGDRIACGVISK